MRLDKFISHATGLPRSASRRAIKAGEVTVNGNPASDAGREVSTKDRVLLRDEVQRLPGERYLMLHKPIGYVCATTDSEHPTVVDLLNLSEPDNQGLSIAGRLDKDTTGLLLLSTDGQWIHRLTSPRHHHPKTYIATLEREVTAADQEAFARGILLRSESSPTRPATLRPLPDKQAEITISEGRYHQIKRMFAATGNRVLSLHRKQIGQIHLDEGLRPGQYRPLSEEEVDSV